MIIFMRNAKQGNAANTVCHAIANVSHVEVFVDRVEFSIVDEDCETIDVVGGDCYERNGKKYHFLTVYDSTAGAEEELRKEFPGCTWE